MVSFINNNSSPILKLEEEYKKAKRLDQKNVEALYVSTINQDNNTPNSRLVNVKYIKNNKRGNILQYKNDFDTIFRDIIKKGDLLMVKGSNATGLNKLTSNIIKGKENVI